MRDRFDRALERLDAGQELVEHDADAEEIRAVVQAYGAYARRNGRGEVDHLYLTSLVDREGAMRVQYLGYRFDANEMLRDLKGLLRE